MYLEKVHLKNYKAVEEMELDLKPGINLVIGDNGAGKTTVLEGISIALGGLFVNVAGVSTKNIVKEDVRVIVKPVGDSSTTLTYCGSCSVGCSLKTCDGNDFSWSRVKEDLSATHTKIDDKSVCVWMKKLTNQPDSLLPLISFQSAARVWKVKRGDFGIELKKKLDDRRCGYIGCLDSSMDVKSIQQWCMKQEVMVVNKGKVREYDTFKSIISIFMKEINELDEAPKVYYSPQFGELVYKDSKAEMALSKLSAGYQSLLWMIMDLAYRVCLLNPELQDRSQIKGIVLVDEVDMHLHPKWQWNIVNALEETFPNVQFILTTHSPIVISSCKNEHLILTTDDQNIVYPENAYGYSVQDVLNFRQGTLEKPEEIKMLTDSFYIAIEEDKYKEAEEILEKMEYVLGTDHADVRDARGELEWNRL